MSILMVGVTSQEHFLPKAFIPKAQNGHSDILTGENWPLSL